MQGQQFDTKNTGQENAGPNIVDKNETAGKCRTKLKVTFLGAVARRSGCRPKSSIIGPAFSSPTFFVPSLSAPLRQPVMEAVMNLTSQLLIAKRKQHWLH